jgi:hypothetical protein
MTPHSHIRRSITALLVATAVVLVAAASAAASTHASYDPWAAGLVQQYRASGSGLDPWAVGLVRQAALDSRSTTATLDPWAVGVVRGFQASGNGLDPWAVGLVRQPAAGRQFAAVRSVQPIMASVTSGSARFSFGDAAIGAGIALLAVLAIGVAAAAVRRRHTPQLSS